MSERQVVDAGQCAASIRALTYWRVRRSPVWLTIGICPFVKVDRDNVRDHHAPGIEDGDEIIAVELQFNATLSKPRALNDD